MASGLIGDLVGQVWVQRGVMFTRGHPNEGPVQWVRVCVCVCPWFSLESMHQ